MCWGYFCLGLKVDTESIFFFFQSRKRIFLSDMLHSRKVDVEIVIVIECAEKLNRAENA